jgi:CheY-like chemotaxis protein
MSLDSPSEHLVQVRDDARLLVTRTSAHKDHVEAIVDAAEQEVRSTELEIAGATRAGSEQLRALLGGQLLRATEHVRTARQLCASARQDHAAALRLLRHVDHEWCADARNVAWRVDAVLVVDDSAEVRHFVARVLQNAGFVVRTAANGLEGLIAAYEMRPGVIVMDVSMPVLDGVEAARLIKSFEPTREARVIALTANPSIENLTQASFVAVLQKPATPALVLAAVQEAAGA